MKKFYQFINKDFDIQTHKAEMLSVFENSPWHYEDSVWAHTMMVLGALEDIQMDIKFNEKAITVARFALLFHDTGKPKARTEKQSESRGIYYSYPGHEQVSAREFEDYFVTNFKTLNEEFGLVQDNFYDIAWMIEHHLPYETKKLAKVEILAKTVKTIEIKLNAPYLFAMILLADARGRICDDRETKLVSVQNWINDFYSKKEFDQRF